MHSSNNSLNDQAWEQIFEKYDVLNQIDRNGSFEISAARIKAFREPRLMAKFDHTINLPKIFVKNGLSILPVTRGDYILSHFDAYHKFEDNNSPVSKVSLPPHIQSLDIHNITSEAIALNCAAVSGIMADFLQDDDLVSTVSGRMGSGTFNFNINNLKTQSPCRVYVSKSQIEIDAAYEGVNGLALFEAKRDLSEDFLVRQLYYPFRVWQDRIKKPVRSVFMIYSNGIYSVYEYTFEDPDNYSSLILTKQKKYSIEDTAIGLPDLKQVLSQVNMKQEPAVSFPQADKFERVINLCELLLEQELSRNDVTERYAFDARQTNYYTDAARYLGLLEKRKDKSTPVYELSRSGRRLLEMSYKQRQLAYCDCILSHRAFNETFKKYLESGRMPLNDEIVQIMKASNLYNVESESTFKRRSSTVRGWLNWMINLIDTI